MIEINQQERVQKLSEKYQIQCIQFFQEILNLQVEIEIRDKKIEELEHKLVELESTEKEEVNVDSTSNI